MHFHFTLIILCGLFLLFLPILFYIITLQNALKEVSPNNRLVQPIRLWLLLIPVFNLIYSFILHPKISDSIAAEFAKKGIAPNGDFAKGLGYATSILALIIPFLSSIQPVQIFLIFLFGLFSIIYCLKISEYKNFLSKLNQ